MPKTPAGGLTAAETRRIYERLTALVERVERVADAAEGKPPPRRDDLELIEGGKSTSK